MHAIYISPPKFNKLNQLIYSLSCKSHFLIIILVMVLLLVAPSGLIAPAEVLGVGGVAEVVLHQAVVAGFEVAAVRVAAVGGVLALGVAVFVAPEGSWRKTEIEQILSGREVMHSRLNFKDVVGALVRQCKTLF